MRLMSVFDLTSGSLRCDRMCEFPKEFGDEQALAPAVLAKNHSYSRKCIWLILLGSRAISTSIQNAHSVTNDNGESYNRTLVALFMFYCGKIGKW